ncbi:MAG: CpsD/CapB family tyrosine-protein kinase [Acidobacteriia bacterium]|nr:CpsD/CapB family tyrosine-protein kinase [Terriglobia bacterium]
MSRIHDALKKAEQERQGTPRPPVTPAAPASRVPTAVVTESVPPPRVEEPAAPPRRLAPAAPAAAAAGGLLERCTVARWNPDPKQIVISQQASAALGMEEFRSLRSRLYQSRDTAPLRIVLITSALPQEGKTFIAANLAHSIVRQRERRALLIDCDLRWSRLHQLLGTQLSPGLTEYLRGEADELAILQRGPLENLFFIPGGKSASNAAELIANGRLKALLDRVAPLFDWVILDSPPAIAMSDASLLADMSDGVLMVVAAGKTPFDLAQKTREQFKKARLLGVTLNRVELRSTSNSYYYGYYDGSKSPKQAKR